MRSCIIFSAEQSNESKSKNNMNTRKTKNLLEAIGIEFTMIEGCYKGTKETSFAVDAVYKELMIEIALNYNQESILFIDAKGESSLYYLQDNHTEVLDGVFKEVAISDALRLECFSRCLETNTYWAVG